MALRFIDSFDHYDTADIFRKWTTARDAGNTVIESGGRNGINLLHISSYGKGIIKVLDDQATWIVGFAFKYTATVTQFTGICTLVDNSTGQISLSLNTNNKLYLTRGGTTSNPGSTVIGGVSSSTLGINTWYFLELKATIANSIGAGTCKVRVNGVEWIDVTAAEDMQVTANATANSIALGMFVPTTSVPQAYFDDLYVCDGTGGTNDDFLGDCRVECSMPNGNGTTNAWTGSDADSTDNYLLVDEVSPDDDTTYVENSGAGNMDLYTVANLAATPATIFGVQTNAMATKSDAGARHLYSIIKSGSTYASGALQSPSESSYITFTDIHETDPSTGVAWVEAGRNAAEFGVETV